MLLAGADLLFDDPFVFFVQLFSVAVSLLIAITFHEAAHALSAKWLGDDTADRLGRITLNPKAHLDPAGTLMLLVAGFGWGKPVPVNSSLLRYGRRGMAMVAAAGPMSNVALAMAFALLFQIGLVDAGGVSRDDLRALDPGAWANIVALYSVLLNLILAVFNLLPLPPLDGGGILTGIAPRGWLPLVGQLTRYGPIVLIVLIGVTILTDLNPLGFFFSPVYDLTRVLTGG